MVSLHHRVAIIFYTPTLGVSSDHHGGNAISAEQIASGFSDKLRLQLHRSKAINLAINVMVAINKADILHLRATLKH